MTDLWHKECEKPTNAFFMQKRLQFIENMGPNQGIFFAFHRFFDTVGRLYSLELTNAELIYPRIDIFVKWASLNKRRIVGLDIPKIPQLYSIPYEVSRFRQLYYPSHATSIFFTKAALLTSKNSWLIHTFDSWRFSMFHEIDFHKGCIKQCKNILQKGIEFAQSFDFPQFLKIWWFRRRNKK